MTSRRLPEGGSWIDRSRPITFRFDGIEYEGFEGDTLASALLANGIVGGFRSPILGRARGIMTAGPEEPNAFVQVSEPWFEPIVAATMVELVDGLVAEPRAGVGRLPRPQGMRTRPVEHRHRHVETLVIGGGPVGRSLATGYSQLGHRVMLVDERHRIDDAPGDGVPVLPRTVALGVYDDGYVVALERTSEFERLWHVRAGRVLLATGATERPLAFAENDRPGVMLASAAETYARRYGVLVGSTPSLVTTNERGASALEWLREFGAEPATVVDLRVGGARVNPTDGTLLVSGGWTPNVALWRAIGGSVRYEGGLGCFVPGDGPPWLEVVGTANGDALPEVAPVWFIDGDRSSAFVDLQRDQTIADVEAALDAGLTSVEHVKRATYIGTAIDQGRTSGVLTAAIVNQLLGAGPDAQGPTSARPPAVPVAYATIAGPNRGDLLDPVRTTRIHPWHGRHGAVFEDVGQWKRPRYFPRDGEDMDAAVARECRAVRNAAGVLDASTLGKIEVVGPGAAAFLDRMYTNRMSTLGVGSIRYGFMLGLDGMVVDDGVAMRLADDRFFVTTTTGNAAMVLDRFEEWLQTEWPELRVYLTSVTEQWADVAIAGPRARDVLDALGTDLDLDPAAFPFMTFRDGEVAGIPARVARVSFTGELSYEVLVDARRGLELWERTVDAGEPFGLTPYGTEAMHLLRAEKGFVIVGQDTDGTVTPHDLGMGWIVRKDASDFLGRRSLRRADTARPDRKQLVGLLPERVLPEGAQLVEEDTGRIPMPMIGHVTSSYLSPTLGRPIALALVERGRERHGQTIHAPLPGGTIVAAIVPPTFYDPEGLRHDG
ncbi:MAG TPA: 2Fe-2S iron-sulfur cluster-binding protein [Actinomycetota bacterium]|nr:2Fe-2S iron-sulfur cluster-binding protein [Actinomycetota bacterium]